MGVSIKNFKNILSVWVTQFTSIPNFLTNIPLTKLRVRPKGDIGTNQPFQTNLIKKEKELKYK